MAIGAAIEAKRRLGGIKPFERIDIPDDWHRTYPATAKGVPTAEAHTATTAGELVASFVDPALDKNATVAIWDPAELTWRPPPSEPRTP